MGKLYRQQELAMIEAYLDANPEKRTPVREQVRPSNMPTPEQGVAPRPPAVLPLREYDRFGEIPQKLLSRSQQYSFYKATHSGVKPLPSEPTDYVIGVDEEALKAEEVAVIGGLKRE